MIAGSPVTFAAGVTSANIVISAEQDAEANQPDETVVITLGTPTRATLTGTTVHTATIRDTTSTGPPGSGSASLSGFVYYDRNQNGVRDGNERGIPGVIVELSGTDSQGNSVNLRALTDDDGAYAFVRLGAGDYTITENQPLAFRDGQDSIGTQGGTVSNDMQEIIDLLAGEQGRNNNFGEAGLVPGVFSRRLVLASTHIPTFLRHENAKRLGFAGSPDDADLIEDSGIPSQVGPENSQGSGNASTSSGAPMIDPIADQQATVGQELSVTVSASDPDDDQLQFSLDSGSPPTAQIVGTGNGSAQIRWTPTAEDAGQPVTFRVIAREDSSDPLSDDEEFMVTVASG